MNYEEMAEIEQRVARLTVEDQLYLIERLLRNLRVEKFTDHAAMEKDLREMAEDPDVRRELELWRKSDAHTPG
ncbi:MAG TPA: hypothetical protein VIL46_07170 [Gemmataceae bacterium]